MPDEELAQLVELAFPPETGRRRKRRRPSAPGAEGEAVEPLFAAGLLQQLREAADNVAREVRASEESWATAAAERAEAARGQPAAAPLPPPASDRALRELGERLEAIERLLAEAPGCPVAGGAVESLLQRTQAAAETGRAKSEAALSSLQQLGSELNEMRVQLSAFGKVVVRNGVRLGELADSVPGPGVPAEPAPPPEAAPYWQSPLFAAGLVLLLVSWGSLAQLKSGDPKYVLVAIALANLTGCAAILASRRAAAEARAPSAAAPSAG